MEVLFWAFVGYLLGSFPTGYVVVRALRGIDIRTEGSGNIGATNVRRVLGKRWAVLVTVVDMLKGGVAVLLAQAFGMGHLVVAVTALMAVVGHNYPVWLGFRGGKGVATTFGTLFFVQTPYSCVAVALAGVLWFVVMKVSRYVSLASMAALFCMVFLLPLVGADWRYGVLAFVLACLSAFRHRENIGRLLGGTERKV